MIHSSTKIHIPLISAEKEIVDKLFEEDSHSCADSDKEFEEEDSDWLDNDSKRRSELRVVINK